MARQDYDGGFRSDGMGAAANSPVSVSSQAMQGQPLGAVAPTIVSEGGIADILTKQQFLDQNQITLANPYGVQGLYTRGVKFDPSNIDYSSLMDEKTRRDLMNLAYDRYRNPFAKFNIFGNEVGGNPETGEVRYGLDSFGSPKETYLGDVVDVPVPKNAGRGVAEMIPGGIGFLIGMLPQEKRKMIEAKMLPDNIPTAAQGRAEYEASKPTGSFLDNIRAALSGAPK